VHYVVALGRVLFHYRSLDLRAALLAGVVFSVAAGLVAGFLGRFWLTVVAIGVAVAEGLVLSRRIAMALDALAAAAHRSAHTGCTEEQFPAGTLISEINRLADTLNEAARAIHHSQADLDRANLEFIETMAQALDARDRYTAGHSLRVGAYSYSIARAMNVPEAEAQTIRIAAQLHDIGKIGIPDAILQKSGKLTSKEYGLIKLHPQIGRRILEKMGRFHEFLPVVELHHENHNGTGYPYMLSGDRIPLAARIVHVADAFDAMVTHRHYRSALSVREAAFELRSNAGTQFDPEVVPVMLQLIEDGKIEAMLQPPEERLMEQDADFDRAPIELIAQ
jgi:HD-GYP domain-containing protein (c-di-GMP phosphodiesterase class II)